MKSDAHRRLSSIELSDTKETRLYVCAKCGTMASTNSGKRFAEDQYIAAFTHEGADLHGKADPEYAVRLTPACPCGCDVFNPMYFDTHRIDIE